MPTTPKNPARPAAVRMLQALHTGAPPALARSRMQTAEWALCAALVLATLLAVGLPAMPLPEGYHDFADQRAWGPIPYAADVLSNLAFALAGAWLWQLQARCARHAHGRMPVLPTPQAGHAHATHTALALVRMTAAGLVATAVCSGIYHWVPGDAGLAIDRLGMSLAFAGVLSLAVAERVSTRAGRLLAWPLLLATAAAALWAWRMGNMLPWAMVQGGGLLLLLGLSTCRAQPGSLSVAWPWVVAAYVLAKGLELGDHAIFGATGGWVAGHTLKHFVAAAAVLPLGWAMLQQCKDDACPA